MKIQILAKILLVLLVACAGCKSPGKKDKGKTPDQIKKEQEAATANVDVDFQAFVDRLRKAVSSRDMNTIAQMMTSDFAYVMGSGPDQDRKGEGVFQYWDEHGLWPELEGILSEKFIKKDEFMVAPPQFANPAIEYDGYRAGIKRVGGDWKFVYFVNG